MSRTPLFSESVHSTCANHSRRAAAERCCYCRKPICNSCITFLQELAFCSQDCTRKHAIKQRIRDLPNDFRKKGEMARPVALKLFCLAFAAFSLNFVYERFAHQINEFFSRKPAAVRSITAFDSDLNFNLSTKIDWRRRSSILADSFLSRKLFETKNEEALVFTPVPKPAASIDQGLPQPLSHPEKEPIAANEIHLEVTSEDFTRGVLESAQIALTFDGGFLDNATDEILESLEMYDVNATMFLTGGFIEKYPQRVSDMLAAGHEIGNHTWSHLRLTSYARNQRQITLPFLTRDSLQNELRRTEEAFFNLTGRKMQRIWRAPYGEHNEEIRKWAAETGFRHIGWTLGSAASPSLDTMDWVADTLSPMYQTPEDVLRKFKALAADSVKSVLNGGVVLMHLGTMRKSEKIHQILPELITFLKKNGYEFVKISEMLQPRRPEKSRGF